MDYFQLIIISDSDEKSSDEESDEESAGKKVSGFHLLKLFLTCILE